MINCTEIDEAIAHAHVTLVESDGGFFALCAALLVASGVLLVWGERVVRPAAAVVGAVGAALATFVATALFDEMQCEARLAASGVAAVVAALLALCIFKTGLFVLGAAGVGAVTHFLWDTLPLQALTPPFVLLGRSGYYYLAMLAAVVVGAVVAHVQRAHFVRISSSLLGGGGVALAVHLVADRTGEHVPSVVLLVVLVGCSLGGVAVQRHLALRRRTVRAPRPRDAEHV